MNMRVSQVLIAVAGLAVATMTLAGGHMAPGDGELRHMDRMAEKLNLSEAQKKDFAALMELYRPRMKELAERGKADRQALLSVAPDDPAYNDLAARVSQDAGLTATETVTLLAELQGLVYSLLTPDQQAQYLELRAERRAKMQEFKESHRDGSHPHGDGHYCPHHAAESAESS